MDLVILDAINADRLKGPEADVQGDLDCFNCARGFGREFQL